MPQHTAADMEPVMTLLVQLWPHPDVTAESFALDAQVYADSDATPATLIAAVRAMRRTRTDPFRPTPAEVISACRPVSARYHRPFVETAGALPPAPVDKTVGRGAIEEMRRRLAGDAA